MQSRDKRTSMMAYIQLKKEDNLELKTARCIHLKEAENSLEAHL